MMISSTLRPLPQQASKLSLTAVKPESLSTPTYFDNFKTTAASEIPRALTYSAIAGAAIGLAGSLLGASPFSSVAQTVAVAAAGGAGVGLASGLLVTAFSSEAGSAPATPQPKEPVKKEPVVPKPVVSPEVVFSKDMTTTKSILDRRISALESVLQAEEHRHETRGRSGLKTLDQARKLFSVAKEDLAEQSKERPAIVGLTKELKAVKTRLRDLRSDQQQVLNIQNRSDKLQTSSLNRSGRHSRDGVKAVTKELEAEVKRLQQAITQSSLPT